MKKLFNTTGLLAILFFAFQTHIYATNQLIARVPGNYTQASAYIQNAVLVSEPHGAYVENSLYLEYADHNAFPGSKTVEIIHRFELPEGSVVNDLWLWIGNSIMKAKMLDTWTGRHIYDSIVVMKRDPAFLTKVGNQYELHIYPLVSDSTRKIKINFITPTKWSGMNATCELPLKFLQAGAGRTDVSFLFRVRQNIWGSPAIVEDSTVVFSTLKDTLGLDYKYTRISNIQNYSSFNVAFSCDFTDGTFFRNNVVPKDDNYFQFGFVPWKIFNLKSADSVSHNILAAIDLSGVYNKNYTTLIPKLKTALAAAMKSGDRFNIIVAGAGKVKKLSSSWIPYSTSNINNILDAFVSSTFGDSVAQAKKPVVTYCDGNAYTIWSFTDIASYAAAKQYSSFSAAMPYFTSSDVVASYDHGYESPLSQTTANNAISSLDTLLANGGRFIGYYDLNRVGKELIATHYIPSLTVKSHTSNAVTLYRNPAGNIGMNFPESLTHNGGYCFSTSDTTVKAELMDANGNPYILSKKVGNGFVIVTGIWPFNDDVPMRKTIAVPMFGLNAVSNNFQLTNMLGTITQSNKTDSTNTAIVFSNCDSLVTSVGADAWAGSYKNSFAGTSPQFKTVNLLDGSGITPSSITINGKEYYGSGYLLQRIADTTSGAHIETHLQDWTSVLSLMKPATYPVIDSLKVTPSLSGGTDTLKNFTEISAMRSDPERPLLYIGSTNSTGSVTFNVDVKFHGIADVKHASYTFPFAVDTTNNLLVIASMLGNIKLNNMFQYSSTDTTGIIKQALKYNLLCDYTSLIALEPNDTIKFMVNPYDESSFVPTDVKDLVIKSDSLGLSIYPNPFNPSTRISVSLANPSSVKITVYDILGREVTHLLNEENTAGQLHVTWNGTDDYGKKIASGIYLISMRGKEIQSGKTFTIIKKAIMLK
jgi:hypothetical protein